MPLAAAVFGFMKLVPTINDGTSSGVKAITTGSQWWVIAMTVAVTVRYISILPGPGRR